MPRVTPFADQPIGVFDSGVGGLTVLHELLVALPPRTSCTSGTPRASRTASARPRSSRASPRDRRSPLEERAKLLVVACNSASAAALPALQAHVAERTLPIDVVGVVGAESVLAVAASRSGRIGLFATPATVACRAYDRAVWAADPHVHLESVACPDLAPIVQGGFPFDQQRGRHRARVLRPAARGPGRHGDPRLHALPAGGADAPALAGPRRDAGPSGAGVARRVERALAGRGLVSPRGRGRLPLPLHGRRGVVPHARHAVPARLASGGHRARGRGDVSGVRRLSQRSTGARPTSCATVAIQPGFVRTATGSALISRARRA